MLEWLMKKGQNSRVLMCIKEVKWELEAADPTRRAAILIVAQSLRTSALSEDAIPASVFDRPLDYSRDDLMRFYGILEDIRNMGTAQLEQNQRGLRRLGIEMPEFAVRHAKDTNKALEIWMCTLGAGICPDRRDDVRVVWRLLADARSHLAEGAAHLKKVERMTSDATGESASMMDVPAWAELQQLCAFVPSSFTSQLPV